MRFLAAFVVIAFAWALVPAALADHVYSHRVVVDGRIVGANGLPLKGALVNVSADGFTLGPPCDGVHSHATDEWGDFWFCFHNHALPDEGVVTVSVGEASQSQALDAELRKMTFFLRDESGDGVAPDAWEKRFRLDGRVWWRSSIELDGVQVWGLALEDEPVRVELSGEAEQGSVFSLTTDGYGDFGATFDLVNGTEPDDVRLDVSARDETLSAGLDLPFHRMVVDFRLPIGPSLAQLVPGTHSPPASMGLTLGFLFVGSVMWALQARKK